MTLRNPPSWLQQGSHPAENDRLLLQTLTGIGGVATGTALFVSQSAPLGMTVNVAAGGAFIPGTNRANQGNYHGYNDASIVVGMSASDTTNPRIDLIVFMIQDADVLGTENSSSIVAVTGIPATTPVAPLAPANSIILAQVAISAGTTQVTDASITDKRRILQVPGSIGNYTSSTRPAPREGLVIYETDTDALSVSDGASWYSVWKRYANTVLSLQNTAAQNIASTVYATVKFSGTVYNDSPITQSNGLFTIPYTGLYAMDGSVQFSNAASGPPRRRLFFESFSGSDPGAGSGKQIVAAEANGTTSGTSIFPGISVSAHRHFVAGDIVRLIAFQNSGTTLTIGTTITTTCNFAFLG